MTHNFPVPASSSNPLASSPLAIAAAPRPGPGPAGPNLYAQLIQNALSPATQRTYAQNLKRFFQEVYGCEPGTQVVLEFLAQDAADMAMQLATYRNQISISGGPAGTGLSSASVKLRLSSINALIDLGHKFSFQDAAGVRRPYCAHDSRGLVKSPTARGYRDTHGPEVEMILKLRGLPDTQVLRGKRDRALLFLLSETALRRAEVCALGVADFEPSPGRIAVVGKGYCDKIWITLFEDTTQAISDYLAAAGHRDGALFRNCAFRESSKGAALTGDGLDDIVRTYGKKLGIKLSPHKFRHFAITAALEQSGGNIPEVQEFSRHKRAETVITYNKNRSDVQGKITKKLGAFLRDEAEKVK